MKKLLRWVKRHKTRIILGIGCHFIARVLFTLFMNFLGF